MIENIIRAGVAVLTAYLLGSIPTGYWLGRMRGIDIRTVGSGNIGASNIQRTLGTWAGILVLLVDVAKGWIAATCLTALTPFPGSDWVRVSCGAAAILGHTFTVFLNFKGGKGVATTYGVLLGLAPKTTVAVFLIFALVVALTKYISLGSIISAIMFPLGMWLLGESGQGFSFLFLSVLIGAVLIIRHWKNIGRIIRGEENKLGQRVDIKSSGRSA